MCSHGGEDCAEQDRGMTAPFGSACEAVHRWIARHAARPLRHHPHQTATRPTCCFAFASPTPVAGSARGRWPNCNVRQPPLRRRGHHWTISALQATSRRPSVAVSVRRDGRARLRRCLTRGGCSWSRVWQDCALHRLSCARWEAGSVSPRGRYVARMTAPDPCERVLICVGVPPGSACE